MLRSTEKDLDGRINILHRTQGLRQPAIDRYKEALAEIEEDHHSGRLEDAIENARSHTGPRLIYFGSLPEEDEKQARSASDDYPWHIALGGLDAPIGQWGVIQEEAVERREEVEETEEDESHEETMEGY